MNHEKQPANARVCLLVMTVILVPGIARAVDNESRGSQVSAPLQSAAGFAAENARQKMPTKEGYVKPPLPANVIAAQWPTAMPRNEKIRILPLTVAKVPTAPVLMKTVNPSVFKTTPVARPAISPVQRFAEKPVATDKKS